MFPLFAMVLPLAEALDQTARLNPDIALSRLRMVESEIAVRIAASHWQPQASAVVSTGYQTTNLQGIGLAFPGAPSRVGPFRTFNARPVVTQRLVDPALLSRVRAARAEVERSRHDADAARESALFTVADFYIRLLEAESLVKAADARIATAGAIVSQTRQRMDAGAASKLDLERAVRQRESEVAARAALTRDRDTLRTLLAQAAGLDSDQIETAPLPTAAAPLPEEDDALRRAASRPDVLTLDAKARVAEWEIQAAKRERLPKLSASADFGALGAGPDRAIGTYAVGATLTIPLWTGRRLESEEAAAAQRLRQVQLERRRKSLEVAQQIRQALAERRAAEDEAKAAGRAAAAARETVELSRLRFESGLATSLDVTTAQGDFVQAEEQQIRALHQLERARLRMAYATGDVRAVVR